MMPAPWPEPARPYCTDPPACRSSCCRDHDIPRRHHAFPAVPIDYLLKPLRAELESIVMRGVEHDACETKHDLPSESRVHRYLPGRGACVRQCRTSNAAMTSTLEAMGDALDLRARDRGHSKRVTAYTIALAQAMGVEADEPARHRARRLSARHRQNRTPDSIL